MFFIWVAAYVCLGMALFGATSPNFSSLDSAILSTTGLFTRHYPHPHYDDDVSGAHLHLWRIFVTTLLIFALGSMNGYVSVDSCKSI